MLIFFPEEKKMHYNKHLKTDEKNKQQKMKA